MNERKSEGGACVKRIQYVCEYRCVYSREGDGNSDMSMHVCVCVCACALVHVCMCVCLCSGDVTLLLL